jgi:glutamyl-tRNA reductase
MFGRVRSTRSTPEYVRENTHPGPDRPSGMSTDGSESLLDRSESAPDPESLQKRLRCRSAKIKREELEAAVSKLEARGDLTDEQRETVRELGASLVEELIGAPERALERAPQSGKTRARARTRAIRRLFDLDES